MEIEIESKKNNPLLNRTEVYFTVKHEGEGTPNREIIRSELADKLNTKKDNIVLNTIHSGFGNQQITGYAKIYSSLTKIKEIEPDYILKRNKLIESKDKKSKEKPAEEKPAEEKPTQEKPTEEKPTKSIEQAKEEQPISETQEQEQPAQTPPKEEEKKDEKNKPENAADETKKQEEKQPDKEKQTDEQKKD
jgi:small subunit ribosomal protein S24e